MKLDPNEVIYAYTQGYFPMAHEDEDDEIYWHKPLKRGVIPLDQFHIPKTLKRLYNKNVFELHINRDFEATIKACSKRDETWISKDILETYCYLNDIGFAHSFEAWQNNKLVGGLYGLKMGKAFFGESMFHTVSNASKIALIHLVNNLKENNYTLLDTQYLNPHLLQFGAIEIEDEEFMNQLSRALNSG